MITIKEWTQIIFEVEIVFSRFSSEFAVFDSLRRYENAVENVKKSKQKQTWLYNDFQSPHCTLRAHYAWEICQTTNTAC